jgi:hypothetical protein
VRWRFRRSAGVTIRLYLDEDATLRALVRALLARGLDVTNAVDAGRTGLTDEEQLAYATAEGRVLYSFNIGDYHRLHGEWAAAGRVHSGIILVAQQRYSIGDQMRRLLRIHHQLSTEDLRGRLEFLARWT